MIPPMFPDVLPELAQKCGIPDVAFAVRWRLHVTDTVFKVECRISNEVNRVRAPDKCAMPSVGRSMLCSFEEPRVSVSAT